MPEAVIVATARSPIGRAVKGSLRDLRPDDLAATIVRAALDKVPAARPARHRRPLPRLRPARRRAGLQHGPRGRHPARATTTCPAPRSPATAPRRCRPPGWRSTRSRPARATCSSPPASSPCPASPGAAPTAAAERRRCRRPWQNPVFAEAQARTETRAEGGADRGTTRARTASCPTSTSPWARPRRTSPQLKGVTRAGAWTSSAYAAQNLAEKAIADGFWAARDHPGHAARRHRGQPPTTARAPGVTLEAVSPAQAGVPPRRHGHRRQLLPAQRRRRRGGHHERHQGRASWASPRWPGSSPPASPRCRPRSWASARSRRPGRRSPAPA